MPAGRHYAVIMPPNKVPPVERRKAERVKVNIKVRWEGVLEHREGTMVDLSISGCFILTAHLVDTGELIRLKMENSLVFWGEVIYQIEEMGFGLRFTATTREERQQLDRLIEEQKKRDQAGK
jgi:PilZ domain